MARFFASSVFEIWKTIGDGSSIRSDPSSNGFITIVYSPFFRITCSVGGSFLTGQGVGSGGAVKWFLMIFATVLSTAPGFQPLRDTPTFHNQPMFFGTSDPLGWQSWCPTRTPGCFLRRPADLVWWNWPWARSSLEHLKWDGKINQQSLPRKGFLTLVSIWFRSGCEPAHSSYKRVSASSWPLDSIVASRPSIAPSFPRKSPRKLIWYSREFCDFRFSSRHCLWTKRAWALVERGRCIWGMVCLLVARWDHQSTANKSELLMQICMAFVSEICTVICTGSWHAVDQL